MSRISRGRRALHDRLVASRRHGNELEAVRQG
jgi:hypothetical protein